jgi:hypothetical protein
MRDLNETSIIKSPKKTIFSHFKYALSNLVSLKKEEKEKKKNFSDNGFSNIEFKNLVHSISPFAANQAICINNEESLIKMRADQDFKELSEKYSKLLEKNDKLLEDMEEMQQYINQLNDKRNECNSPQLRHRKPISSLNILEIRKKKSYFDEEGNEFYNSKKIYSTHFIIVQEEMKRKFFKNKPLILYTNFFEVTFNLIKNEKSANLNEGLLHCFVQNKEEIKIIKLQINLNCSQSLIFMKHIDNLIFLLKI